MGFVAQDGSRERDDPAHRLDFEGTRMGDEPSELRADPFLDHPVRRVAVAQAPGDLGDPPARAVPEIAPRLPHDAARAMPRSDSLVANPGAAPRAFRWIHEVHETRAEHETPGEVPRRLHERLLARSVIPPRLVAGRCAARRTRPRATLVPCLSAKVACARAH